MLIEERDWMARRLSFGRRCLDGVVVLDLSGDLVVGPSADTMWQMMSQVWNDGTRKVMLNFSGVEYIDSTGVGALLAAQKSATELKAQFKLCCLPPNISNVLGTLRVATVLETFADEARALASFSADGGSQAACAAPAQ